MSGLFITVFNMSLTATYAALFVIAARFVLSKAQAPKIFAYCLWAVVLFRLVWPFSFESPLSLLPGRADAIPHDMIYSGKPGVSTGITFVDHTVDSVIRSVLPPADATQSVNPIGIVLEAGTAIWMLGIAALLLYGILSFFRLKRSLAYSTLVRDHIFETDRIHTPFVLGMMKPRIYLPTRLAGTDLDYILKHEQTHIRRFDHLIKPLSFLVLAVHWFNPLIWICYFLMIKDMEMSCDEAVLKQTNDDVRADYSSTLLALATRQRRFFSPLSFGESSVKSRIRNILGYRRPVLLIVFAAIAIVLTVAAGTTTNPVKKLEPSPSYAEQLMQYKTPYVGNHTKVGGILSLLEYPDRFDKDYLELHTRSVPYGVTLHMKGKTDHASDLAMTPADEALFMKNAVIMFALVDNVDFIKFNLTVGTSSTVLEYTRKQAEEKMGGDVRRFSQNNDDLARLLESM